MPERDFLKETLRVYPAHASFALWRAIELRLLCDVDFPEPVLDVGCGEGGFARMLFGPGRNIVGLDLQQPELRLAARSGAYRHIVRADATALPFPEATFASCLSNCVLEHIPDDAGVVREIGRVLRPAAPSPSPSPRRASRANCTCTGRSWPRAASPRRRSTWRNTTSASGTCTIALKRNGGGFSSRRAWR